MNPETAGGCNGAPLLYMNPETAGGGNGAKMVEKPTEFEQVINHLQKIISRAHSVDERIENIYSKLAGGICKEKENTGKPARMGIVGEIFDLLESIDEVQESQEKQLGMIRNII